MSESIQRAGIEQCESKMGTYSAIISIGSNFGNREKNVRNAIEWLSSNDDVIIIKRSDIYETPEVYGNGSAYINAVAEIGTSLSLGLLTDRVKKFEISSGRNSECRDLGLVPIDIDIVVWNQEVIRPKDFSCDFFKIGYLAMNDNNG